MHKISSQNKPMTPATNSNKKKKMTSLGSKRKVKTTRELYADLVNRNYGFSSLSSSPTLSNWAQNQLPTSRSESSCSEPSLLSPYTMDATSNNRTTPDIYVNVIDEAESNSCYTIISDSSRDSIAQKPVPEIISLDSSSNSQFPLLLSTDDTSTQFPKAASSTATVEAQLRELVKQLLPVPNIKDIELNSMADIVPCTCKILEVLPNEIDNLGNSVISSNHIKEEFFDNFRSISPSSDILISIPSHNVSQKAGNSSTVPTTMSNVNKPKKSIFDLDFDEEEDPLHLLKAEAAKATLMQDSFKTENVTITSDQVDIKPDITSLEQQLEQNSIFSVVDSKIEPEEQPQPTYDLPTYEIEEDPNCVAKQKFELQPQMVTKFHVNALHNSFISNVNGNWNYAAPLETANCLNKNTLNNLVTDGSNVVVKYGSLVDERIPKDLSCTKFSKKFKRRKAKIEIPKEEIPFLGVSRTRQQNFDAPSECSEKFKTRTSIGQSNHTTNHSLFEPQQESQTGVRVVDEDVVDEDGNNCARIQEFKEWHQILQLRSYDDDLLTVLPYVILD